MTIEQYLKRYIQKIKLFLTERLHLKSEYLHYIIPFIIGLLICVFTLKGFVELTEELRDNNLTQFDDMVSEFFHNLRSDSVNSYVIFMTDFGDKWGYAAIILFMTLYFAFTRRGFKLPIQVVVVSAITMSVNLILKSIINRPRPTESQMIEVFTLSYPSGHAMVAMSFYGFLIYLSWAYLHKRWLKTGLTIIFIFLILNIGLSRIYLGVHYPSDILAGYIAGLFWATFCVLLFNLISVYLKKKRA
jgi:undecaprenyl-diphosphatase